MLLEYAEANAVDTSGAHNGGDLRPPLRKWGKWDRRASAAGPIWGIHYAPLHGKLLGCWQDGNLFAVISFRMILE